MSQNVKNQNHFIKKGEKQRKQNYKKKREFTKILRIKNKSQNPTGHTKANMNKKKKI